jgi:hypothetical protein
MRLSNRAKTALIFVFTVTAPTALAHQAHHHAHPGAEATSPMTRKEGEPEIKVVREGYRSRIEPIFQKSCMDCHSAQTRYPWYHKIPGIKQMLDSDIREAKHHLDLSDGYPFKSHATPIEDLDAIAESVQKGTMPSLFYRIMHRSDAMTHEEKKAVLEWAEKSKELLKKKN